MTTPLHVFFETLLQRDSSIRLAGGVHAANRDVAALAAYVERNDPVAIIHILGGDGDNVLGTFRIGSYARPYRLSGHAHAWLFPNKLRSQLDYELEREAERCG